MILFDKRLTKALISLRGCAGWSVPLLFGKPPKTGFHTSRPRRLSILGQCRCRPRLLILDCNNATKDIVTFDNSEMKCLTVATDSTTRMSQSSNVKDI